MEKARSLTCAAVSILQVLTLRAGRLGKSWERVRSWPVPQTDINYCLRSQERLHKHKPDPLLPCVSPNCRRQTARLGTGSLCPQQEVFTNQRGLEPGQGFQGQASGVRFQGAAARLSRGGLAGPGCRATGSLLGVRAPPGSGHGIHRMRGHPRQHREMHLPKADM